MDKLLIDRDEQGVVWATINRQEKRNAIDYDVMNQLKTLLQEIANNDRDKMLVITGAGEDAFCSGGDLSAFHNLYTKEAAYEMLSKMGDILYDLLTLPKPTVALINGTAIGGGCELATACDFRLAKESAKLGFVQGKLAITTGWGGASMLYEKLPIDKAMEMLMSAKRYTAKEAKELGFIQELFPSGNLKEQCRQWTKAFITQNSGVLTAYKEATIAKWEHTNIRYRMFEEIKKCSILWEKDDHHQAVEAFLTSKNRSK